MSPELIQQKRKLEYALSCLEIIENCEKVIELGGESPNMTELIEYHTKGYHNNISEFIELYQSPSEQPEMFQGTMDALNDLTNLNL